MAQPPAMLAHICEVGAVQPFVAAKSKLEATARLYALTGTAPEPLGPGSKERKSVLIGVADALAADVRLDAPKPELGRELVARLGGTWDESCYSAGATITLAGLNRLLEVASAEFARRSEARRFTPSTRSATHENFRPARSKLEAVNRISALTSSGPQDLGPGSKERKSVLTDLVSGLGLGLAPWLSKTALAERIAELLGSRWDDSCWSVGETITLDGFNVLLEGAERHLGHTDTLDPSFRSLDDEAAAILGVLHTAVGARWDGRTSVEEMRGAEFRHWRQSEWIGFYFEFIGIPALVNAFGGGPLRVGNVTFDYSLGVPWDLKAHSDSSTSAILNDARSVDDRLRSGALGFVVLSGSSEYDEDGLFDNWHRRVTRQEKRHRMSNSRNQRRRKLAFRPTSLDAYLIRDQGHRTQLIAGRALAVRAQGRQSDGRPRAPKYHLDLKRAEAEGMRVAHIGRAD